MASFSMGDPLYLRQVLSPGLTQVGPLTFRHSGGMTEGRSRGAVPCAPAVVAKYLSQPNGAMGCSRQKPLPASTQPSLRVARDSGAIWTTECRPAMLDRKSTRLNSSH